jgi:hypothetical protein
VKKTTRRRWHKNPFALNIALQNVTLVKDAGPDNTRMRIVSHDAMDVLRQGNATRGHLQMIVEVANMAETLASIHDLGRDWLPEIHEAQEAIRAVAARGVEIGRYVLRAPELNALNLLLEIHDAQLDACSVQTLGKAVEYIRGRIAANEVIRLPAMKEAA